MARPRTFNEHEVTENIRNLFWKKGYADTSIADLEAATGLKRTSLYAAFGDKQSLYLTALKSYKSMTTEILKQHFSDSKQPLESIKSVLVSSVCNASDDPECKGCFFINAGAERFNECKDTSQIISTNRQQLIAIFEGQLGIAQQLGALSPDASIEKLAVYLYTLYTGLILSTKKGATKQELMDVIEVSMKPLEA